jgi:hypothetical protein
VHRRAQPCQIQSRDGGRGSRPHHVAVHDMHRQHAGARKRAGRRGAAPDVGAVECWRNSFPYNAPVGVCSG